MSGRIPRPPAQAESPTSFDVLTGEAVKSVAHPLEKEYTTSTIGGVAGRIDITIPPNMRSRQKPTVSAIAEGLAAGLSIFSVGIEAWTQDATGRYTSVRLRVQDLAVPADAPNGTKVLVFVKKKWQI
jgi:hypothetical protein